MIVHDVRDYVTQRVPPPPFHVQELLPKGGVLLLYGVTGVMKSWLAQHMAFCIATGSDWLSFRTVQGRCFLANFEISPSSYHHRLELMSQHFALEEQMFIQASPSIMYLEQEENFREFQAAIEEAQPEVIILDCLSGCFGGDENNGREVSDFIAKMTELRGNNRSLVIIHHSNKNPLAQATDKARGHTKLTGWVDSILYVVNQPSCKQIQFSKTRHATRTIHSMNVVFENYLWRIRTGTGGNTDALETNVQEQ